MLCLAINLKKLPKWFSNNDNKLKKWTAIIANMDDDGKSSTMISGKKL